MKAYLTNNNAFDAVIITDEDGTIVCAAQIDRDLFEEFHADDPEFGDWSFGAPYALTIDDDAAIEDYGSVYASRVDSAAVEVIDSEMYNDRAEFYRQRGE